MNAFIENFNKLIGNEAITTLIVSILPLIELKGSILFARASGLGFFLSLLYSYIGSTIVFIPIFFLLQPILNLLKKIKWFNKLAVKVESFFVSKAETLKEKNKKGRLSEVGMKALGIFIFVAIPLPMTGVWTGTAIAVFLGLKFKDAVLPIALGNLVAGIIISILAEVFYNYIDYILYGLLAVVILGLAITIIKIALSKPKESAEKKDGEK